MAGSISAKETAAALSIVSGAAMLYVGLYQVRVVKRLVCPVFGGCESVADAPFARPFGIPDGFIGAALYAAILILLLMPGGRPPWLGVTLLVMCVLATAGNAVGVWDMARLGALCFFCLLTTLLSPLLLWAVWLSR